MDIRCVFKEQSALFNGKVKLDRLSGCLTLIDQFPVLIDYRFAVWRPGGRFAFTKLGNLFRLDVVGGEVGNFAFAVFISDLSAVRGP